MIASLVSSLDVHGATIDKKLVADSLNRGAAQRYNGPPVLVTRFTLVLPGCGFLILQRRLCPIVDPVASVVLDS